MKGNKKIDFLKKKLPSFSFSFPLGSDLSLDALSKTDPKICLIVAEAVLLTTKFLLLHNLKHIPKAYFYDFYFYFYFYLDYYIYE